jgi:hypothetical protein
MSLTKPTLSNLRAAATSVAEGDPYFSDVTLLLSSNGSNGSTTFTDSSKHGWSASVTNGTNISTTQSKFGGASMYFDGSADNIWYAGGSHWDQVGAHTIEFWVRLDDISDWRGLYAHGNNSNNSAFKIWYNSSNNTISVKSYPVGSFVHSTTTTAVDTWYHVAWVKESASVGKLYINGTMEGSTTSYADHTPSTSHYMVIGTNYDTNYGNWYYGDDMYGYIDDYRITKGVARYTSNFTPPTTAFATSAGDINKPIVVNTDADGVMIGYSGTSNQERIAKAWVNFNGTGTIAIRESYNISSLTDRGTGLYTLNYSSNLSSADCSGAGAAVDATGDATERNRVVNLIPNNVSSSYVNAYSIDSPTGADDCEIVTFLIFGN